MRFQNDPDTCGRGLILTRVMLQGEPNFKWLIVEGNKKHD